MKKTLVAVVSMAALVACAQDFPVVRLSAVTNLAAFTNLLELPVEAGPHGKVFFVKRQSVNMEQGALCVSHVFLEYGTERIVGGMGSCTYPTIAEGAFAMTNTILKAVGKKTGDKAMVVPPYEKKVEGCMEMVYWWKPDPKSDAELELVVRAYASKSRQLAVCTCLHTKGDDIHYGFRKFKKYPAAE